MICEGISMVYVPDIFQMHGHNLFLTFSITKILALNNSSLLSNGILNEGGLKLYS